MINTKNETVSKETVFFSEILKDQLTKFDKDDIIQIMSHPGFYWKMINHKTPFSNKNRVEELDSLKVLKDILNIEDVEYINYNKI